MPKTQLRPFGWRTVWVLALFDLPTETKQQRKAYARFRKDLLKDGFSMMQYSVYQRHCASTENAEAHIQRMRKPPPDEGEVRAGSVCLNSVSGWISGVSAGFRPPRFAGAV